MMKANAALLCTGFVLSVCWLGALICPMAGAVTLEASVAKSDLDDISLEPKERRHRKHRLFGRIGVRIDCVGHIAKVRPGSPAALAGLLPHDRVLLVDGRKHAIDDIIGEPGTTVQLDVKRKQEHFQVAVERVDNSVIRYY